jgi:hypothetical protein
MKKNKSSGFEQAYNCQIAGSQLKKLENEGKDLDL